MAVPAPRSKTLMALLRDGSTQLPEKSTTGVSGRAGQHRVSFNQVIGEHHQLCRRRGLLVLQRHQRVFERPLVVSSTDHAIPASQGLGHRGHRQLRYRSRAIPSRAGSPTSMGNASQLEPEVRLASLALIGQRCGATLAVLVTCEGTRPQTPHARSSGAVQGCAFGALPSAPAYMAPSLVAGRSRFLRQTAAPCVLLASWSHPRWPITISRESRDVVAQKTAAGWACSGSVLRLLPTTAGRCGPRLS